MTRDESEHQQTPSQSLAKDPGILRSIWEAAIEAAGVMCNPTNASLEAAHNADPHSGSQTAFNSWRYRSLSGQYGATHT